MLFRVHAETNDGFDVKRDVQAGSPTEAATVARKLWGGEGVAARVLKTKLVRG